MTTSEAWTQDQEFLDVDFEKNAVDMLPGGVTAVIYSHDCASILGAAAAFNSSLTFPAASIASAIKASMENDANARLGMVVGRFESPLFKALADDRVSTYAHLLLWDFYRNKVKAGADITKRYWAASQLEGIALYWVTKRKQKFSGEVSLDVSGSFFGAKASGSTSATLQRSSALELRNFMFAPFKRDGDPKTVVKLQLPSASDLSGYLERANSAWLDTSQNWSDLLVGESTHTQVLDRVPERLCTDGSGWTITQDAGGNRNLKIVGISPKLDKEYPACAFRVRYIPTDQDLNGGGIRLNYYLSLPAGALLPRIRTQEIVYRTTTKPQLTLVEPVPSPWTASTIDQQDFLNWRIKVRVDQDLREVDNTLNAGNFSKLKLQCAGSRVVEKALFASTPSVVKSSPGQPPDLTFTLQYGYDSKQSGLDIGSYELCTFSGDVLLPLQGAGSVTRSLPGGIDLRFPKIKPTAPVAPPAVAPDATRPADPPKPVTPDPADGVAPAANRNPA